MYLRVSGSGPFPLPGEKRRLRRAMEQANNLMATLKSLGANMGRLDPDIDDYTDDIDDDFD